MSDTNVRISKPAAPGEGPGTLLELLAPDRKPELKLYGEAAAARMPRMPRLRMQETIRLQPAVGVRG
jgi:hypothetical protein